jgi:hypothetical protein
MENNSDLRQQICEIRFKANPLILDNRGLITKLITSLFKLEEWTIGDNVIVINSKDKSERLFVAFDRMGISLNEIKKRDMFKDETLRFLNFVFSMDIFKEEFYVNRIGVRTRNCFGYDKSFDSLKDKCLKNYISVSPKVIDKLGLNISDVGYPLIFKDGKSTVNTNCGPMKQEQIKKYFQDYINDAYPNVGLYIDVDYHIAPNQQQKFDDVLNYTADFCTKSEQKSELLKTIILNGVNHYGPK